MPTTDCCCFCCCCWQGKLTTTQTFSHLFYVFFSGYHMIHMDAPVFIMAVRYLTSFSSIFLMLLNVPSAFWTLLASENHPLSVSQEESTEFACVRIHIVSANKSQSIAEKSQAPWIPISSEVPSHYVNKELILRPCIQECYVFTLRIALLFKM